jgi:hypothetical protein
MSSSPAKPFIPTRGHIFLLQRHGESPHGGQEWPEDGVVCEFGIAEPMVLLAKKKKKSETNNEMMMKKLAIA